MRFAVPIWLGLLGAAGLAVGCQADTLRPRCYLPEVLPSFPTPDPLPATPIVQVSCLEPESEVAGAMPTHLTLAYVLQATQAANPDLQSALERTNAAGATLERARADFYPLLAINSNYMGSDNPFNRFQYLLQQGETSPAGLFNPPGTVDNLQGQVRLQQMLYTHGLGKARLQGAAAEHSAACHSLAAVQNLLAYQVTEAYYRYFQAAAIVPVRLEAVNAGGWQREQVQSRIRAGTGVPAELLQVEARLAEVQAALCTAINNRALALALLENLTGVKLGRLPLPPELPPAPWGPRADTVEAAVAGVLVAEACPDVETAVTDALQARPEVAQGQCQQEAAQQRVKAVQAARGPTVGLVADYDAFAGTNGNERGSFFAGLALSLNLCDCGRTRADRCQAEAQVREIAARNRRLQLDIELDVRRSFLRLKDAQQRAGAAAAGSQSAAAALRQLESRYANQSATVVEVCDAQLALTEARVRLLTAQADIEIARTSLEQAVGRLTGVLQSEH